MSDECPNATERKKLSRERKKLGLERLVLWIPPHLIQKVKDLIKGNEK